MIIGTVPYLNSKPLTRWFQTDEGRTSGIEVIEAVPSHLAHMLEQGEIAAALVSSFDSLRHPEYAIVPGVSISGQDAIKSVRVFARLPFSMVQSIAMDSSSLTSVALTMILLDELYDAHPQRLSMRPDLQTMLAGADAALLIGDNGMLANGKGLEVLDVGKAWRRLTGLPFTYAVWLGRPENVTAELTNALQAAKEYGLTQIDVIAEEEAERLGCPYAVCYDYLANVMDYNLEDEHYQALALFKEKCRSQGLV
ncbi:MAG TPA: menaquinone biosynthesis protein [Capsulimonadaceae bacterium]|nr:menaquinone biosynthesis protein [Capsulimonadaceae bacterium]